jgi:hypothetical protein
MHMPEDDVGVAPAQNRYRALLDVSAALVEQPTVKAVLHSLREVLSSSVRLHGTDLYLLDSGQQTLHLLEFDREADAPAIKVGTKISKIGAAAQALEQQEPVFLPDISPEMLKHPELAPFAAQSIGRSSYISARKKESRSSCANRIRSFKSGKMKWRPNSPSPRMCSNPLHHVV